MSLITTERALTSSFQCSNRTPNTTIRPKLSRSVSSFVLHNVCVIYRNFTNLLEAQCYVSIHLLTKTDISRNRAWLTSYWSEAKGLLDEPRTRLKFGDRAFSISAPRLWNALPQHLKESTSCQAFKKCLKTHLFRLAHWGVVDYDSNYDNVQRFWTFYEWKRRYINSNYYYYYYIIIIIARAAREIMISSLYFLRFLGNGLSLSICQLYTTVWYPKFVGKVINPFRLKSSSRNGCLDL